jgi:hypothetical protein
MKRPRIPRTCSLLLLLAVLLFAAPVCRALDVDDILRLKAAGVTEETILRVVDDARAVLRLSVDDILDLKNAGCSDDLIHALLDTPERFGPSASGEEPGDAYDNNDNGTYGADLDYGDFGLDNYDFSIYDDDYETVFVHHYYDPFGYCWYPWPRSYFYWSPFWWSHAGFYYGGHWCRDWWDPWGPCTWYCDWNWGYHRYCGPSRTRLTARHLYEPEGRGAAAQRMTRESNVYRRAGLALAPDMRVRTTASVVRHAPATRSAAGVRTLRAPGESRLRAPDATGYRREAVPPRAGTASRAPRERSSGRATYRRPESGTSRSPAPAPRRGEVGRGRSVPAPAPAPSPAAPSSPSVSPRSGSRTAPPPPAPSGRSSAPAPASPRSGSTRSHTRT